MELKLFNVGKKSRMKGKSLKDMDLPGRFGCSIAAIEKKGRAVAAVHAGWKGMLGGIVEKTVGEIRRNFKIRPDDLPMLQATLSEALSDPGRLQRMGLESYRIVTEEVNLEVMVAAFITALNTVRLPIS